MGIRSTFRSTMTRTGRDEGVPEEDVGRWPWLENRFVLESRMWSLSLRSNFAAIISAGPPLGTSNDWYRPCTTISKVN